MFRFWAAIFFLISSGVSAGDKYQPIVDENNDPSRAESTIDDTSDEEDEEIIFTSADGEEFNFRVKWLEKFFLGFSKSMQKMLIEDEVLPYFHDTLQIILGLIRLAYHSEEGADYSHLFSSKEANYSEVVHFFVVHAPRLKYLLNIPEKAKPDVIAFVSAKGKTFACDRSRLLNGIGAKYVEQQIKRKSVLQVLQNNSYDKIELNCSSDAVAIIAGIFRGDFRLYPVKFNAYLVAGKFIEEHTCNNHIIKKFPIETTDLINGLMVGTKYISIKK